MVHVEKMVVKGNVYYKLVHNIRKGKKITSKSRYLGKELPAPKILEKLKQEFYTEIQVERSEQVVSLQSVPPLVSVKKKEETVSTTVPLEKKNSLSEQKKENILEKEYVYKAVTQSLQEVVYVANPLNFSPIYINDAVQKIFGYTPEEWLNDSKSWEKTIYPDDKKYVLKALRLSQKNKVSIDITYRIITHEHHVRWVINHINWKKDTQGNLISLWGVMEEITPIKEAQDKLDILFNTSLKPVFDLDFSKVKMYLNLHNIKTEEDLKKRFAKNPHEFKELIAMVNVVDVNAATLKLFKIKDKQQFQNFYITNQLYTDSKDVFIKELLAIAQNKNEFQNEILVVPLKGKKIPCIMTWNVLHLHKGVYGIVLVTLSDISLQRRLAEVLNIKDYAIESSGTALLFTDYTGKINYANQAFIDMWNIDNFLSLRGMNVKKYLPHKKEFIKIMREVYLHKKWRGILTLGITKQLYIETSATLVFDDFNDPIGIVFSFIDITELKKSEQIRLEFTNIAAHELKTPLTPLRTLLTMLCEDPKQYGINEKGILHLTVCLRNVKRLNSLTNDILDISRLEAGGMKFVMTEFDLLKTIKLVVDDYFEEVKKNGLEFRQDIPKTLPLVYGDQQRISQVIGNLIKNAINFTDKGTILIRVSLDKEGVHVDVIDTGVGISKLAQAKLFTKFFQEQDITTRKTKGSGLGLAITKEIIIQHHGKIWAFSKGKGKGTTISFILPLKKKAFTIEKKKKKEEKRMLIGDKLLIEKEKSDKVKRKFIKTPAVSQGKEKAVIKN